MDHVGEREEMIVKALSDDTLSVRLRRAIGLLDEGEKGGEKGARSGTVWRPTAVERKALTDEAARRWLRSRGEYPDG
jgi:hypothetical protein